METKDIERSRLSALAEYAPLSGILILAALMCFCVFFIANQVKRSGAVVVQSAQHETIGEPLAPIPRPDPRTDTAIYFAMLLHQLGI